MAENRTLLEDNIVEASIVDLRYHMNEVRKAINQNEVVKITFRGQVIADIMPRRIKEENRVQEHPFFGSLKEMDVEDVMNKLRGNRYDAV